MAYPNEPSWRSEDTVRLAPLLFEHGVDFLDVSSAGNDPRQKIVLTPDRPAFQAHFAEAIKKALNLPSIPSGATAEHLVVGSVGGIRDGKIAQEVLDKGQADVVLLGRAFMKNPGVVWKFAEDLAAAEELAEAGKDVKFLGAAGKGHGVRTKLSNQIQWAFFGRAARTRPPTEGDVRKAKV